MNGFQNFPRASGLGVNSMKDIEKQCASSAAIEDRASPFRPPLWSNEGGSGMLMVSTISLESYGPRS